MSETRDDAVPAIELADVRTIEDATAWLHVRAAGFAEAEKLARSPVDAKGFGLASSTTGALAELLGMTDPKTAARMLLTMGTDYAHVARNEAARREPAYWRACLHLASTLAVLGAQLIVINRPRSSLAGKPPARDYGRQL